MNPTGNPSVGPAVNPPVNQTVNQGQFEAAYQAQWDQFRQTVEALECQPAPYQDADKPDQTMDRASFPAQYRRLCNHYGLARTRHYSPALVDKLHGLVLRGHRQLYRKKNNWLWTGLNFVARQFPRTLRRTSRMFWLACLLFYGPAVAVGIATYQDPLLIYSLMGEDQVLEMESMYGPDNIKPGRSSQRDAETDFTMFGFYILNNISIGFRSFAGGIVFGLGTVFFLVFNGLILGGVAGHLSHPPYLEKFWPFVSGHGALELTAIVICGAAGLILGQSLLRPGRYRRLDALRRSAPTALVLVMGAALMLVGAAFIEAFWSSSGFTAPVKFAVAAINWLLVIFYLLLAGRGARES